MSTFARSDAVHIPGYMPRKQNSTPNPPTAHRIYDRSHVYSRSWNPECSSPPTHSSQQSAHFSSYHYNRPDDFQYNTSTDRYPSRQSYEAAQADQYSSDACYDNAEQIYPQQLFIPTINEPAQSNSLAVRQFQRQAKSFDDRARVADSRRPSMADRRTVSVTEPRNQFVRQATVQQHTSDESPVTKACHSLWAAKGHLEQLHALGISDPSSASTSFDSNTDSQSIAMETKPKQEENADRKRMKYNVTRKDSQQSVRKHQALDRRRSFRASCKRASAFTQDITQKRRSNPKIEFDHVLEKPRRSSYCPPPTILCSGQSLHYNKNSRYDMIKARNNRRYSMMPTPSDHLRRDNLQEMSRKNLSHDHVDYRHRRMSQIIPENIEAAQHFSKSMDHAYRRDSFDYQNHRPSNRRMSDLHWNQRSLLIQRKFLSTTAVSSMDSTNSTESSAHDPIFTSSVDSLKSDLEQRRLSLMTRHSNVSSPHICGHSRLERDYSVDTKSDNLFREWSRVDPAYAARDHREYTPCPPQPTAVTPIRLQRGSTQDQYNQPHRERIYGRQMTIAGTSHVVPFICYPDEQNCSR